MKKYIDIGVKVESNLKYKSSIVILNLSNKCYRCKTIIDPSTEYSYLCIKCKNKQYCNQCINFFNSFKKFGSQLTILNEIEDYNEYINNNIIDDLPCESNHLLMFIPPDTNKKKDETTIIQYNNLYVCLRYSSHNRNRKLCDLCNFLSPDLIENQEHDIKDNFELSVDNSLYLLYRRRKREKISSFYLVVSDTSVKFAP